MLTDKPDDPFNNAFMYFATPSLNFKHYIYTSSAYATNSIKWFKHGYLRLVKFLTTFRTKELSEHLEHSPNIHHR